jgi:small neutral amino acid transporter SnatA (MarC family)
LRRKGSIERDHRIGEGGATVIGRVFRVLLAALAVNMVPSTVIEWVALPNL